MSGKRTRALRLELREHLQGAGQGDDRRYRKIVRATRQRMNGTPRPRRALPVRTEEGGVTLITNLPRRVSYDGRMSRLAHRRFWG